MTIPDVFLFCFALGTLWTVLNFALGGLHSGHGGHTHPHHGHVHHGHAHHATDLLNPSSLGVFLAWFGGVGYLLTRHTGWLLWVDGAVALLIGLGGAWLVAAFLRFLQAREQPLDPSDYEMTGTLGRVSATIRPDGVGELLYTRAGARCTVAARSETGVEIARGVEAIVMRFEKGIAYVRTWDAVLAQPGSSYPETLPKKGSSNVH